MRTISIPAASLLFFILAVPCSSQPSSPSSETKPEGITSESLLQRAHSMLPALSPSDRMAVLFQLVRSSGKKHPEIAAAWMDEALNAASHIPDRDSRAKNQILLVYSLSYVDSRAALDKLATLDPPLHPGEYDPRVGAATWAIDNFYHDHPAELERIIAVARHIGDTGSYPFSGVSNVLGEAVVRDVNVHPPNPETLEAAGVLVRDAIRYFTAMAPSDDTNAQFAYFIRSYSKFIPPESLKPALQDLVERLMGSPLPPANRMITMIPDKGDAPPIISRNHNDVLLAELMPVVRSVDPTWEQELRQSPKVNGLADRMEDRSGLVVWSAYGDGKSDETAMQQLQVANANMLAQRQPERALKALDEITDSVNKTAAAANIALLLNDSRPQDSAQLLVGVQEALVKTKAPQDRITILSSLVHTLADLKQADQLAAALDQSFAVADDMMAVYAAKHRDSESARLAAPAGLTWIVQNSAQVIPEHTLARINEVRIPVLQADLLIAMARGLDAEQDRIKAKEAQESKK